MADNQMDLMDGKTMIEKLIDLIIDAKRTDPETKNCEDKGETMERLTSEVCQSMRDFCTEINCPLYNDCPGLQRYNKLKEYEDTGLTPAEVVELIGNHANTANELAWTKGQLDNIVKQLGLYHDGMLDSILEFLKINKEGRLLLLPCALGSEVYVISHKYRAGRDEWWINTGKFRPSDMEKIGDRVFLTYEDAKAKIFAMNKDNERFWFQDVNGEVFYN